MAERTPFFEEDTKTKTLGDDPGGTNPLDFSRDGTRRNSNVSPISGMPVEGASDPFKNQIQSFTPIDQKPFRGEGFDPAAAKPFEVQGDVETENKVEPIVSPLSVFEGQDKPETIQSFQPIKSTAPIEETDTPVKAEKKLTKRDPKDIEADENLKTAENMSNESDEILQGILEGDDPIRTTELNNYINLMAPSNQAQAEALMLKMKQEGVDSGALNSMIFSAAIAQGRTMSETIAGINSESANRLYEVAKWGVDRGHNVRLQDLELRVQEASLKESEHSNYKDILDLMQTTIPGVVFNAQAYENAIEDVPSIKGEIDMARQQIRNHINSESPKGLEDAKQVLVDLATKFPKIFGDPEQYRDWNPNNLDKIAASTRKNALRSEASKLISADAESEAFDLVKGSLIDPDEALVDFDGTFARNERLQDNEEVLEIANLDENVDLWSDEDKIDYMAADMVWDIKRQGIKPEMLYDSYVDTLVGDDKEWLMNNKDPFLEWVSNIEDIDWDSETDLLVPKLKNMIPPWEPDSPGAYQYYTWPTYTFDEDGDIIERIDEGMDFKGDLESLSPEIISYNNSLDRKYSDYIKSDPSIPLTMQEWYTETAGGVNEITEPEVDIVINPDTSLDKEQNRFTLNNAISQEDYNPTDDEVFSSINSVNINEIPTGDKNVDEYLARVMAGDSPDNPGGWMNVNGVALKLSGDTIKIEGGVDKNDELTRFTTTDGMEVFFQEDEDRWMIGVPHGNLNTRVYLNHIVEDFENIMKSPAERALLKRWYDEVVVPSGDEAPMTFEEFKASQTDVGNNPL